MQNLFVKLLVLGSVIGGSSFVVWQAHNGLTNSTGKVTPSEFVSLTPAPKSSRSDKPSDAVADWESPLKLAEPSTSSPPQETERILEAQEQQSPQPMLAAETSSAKQKLDDSEFPLFFNNETRATNKNALPPQQSEEDEIPEPQPTPRADSAELAMQLESPAQEFSELPDQQVEKPEPTMTTGAEPEPTLAQSMSPPQSEGLEAPTPKVLRFGPDTEELPAKSEVTQTSAQSLGAPEMPGLTKLPPSHPGPVLLPIENSQMTSQSAGELPSGVVNADAVESELEPVQKASDTSTPAMPRELVPAAAASPVMPLELPEPTPAPQRMSRELPPSDPYSIDPFGLPEAKKEPVPTPTKETPVLPERLPASAPAVSDPFGLPEAKAQPTPTLRREMPVLPEPTPTAAATAIDPFGLPAAQPEPTPAIRREMPVLPDTIPEKVPVGNSPFGVPAAVREPTPTPQIDQPALPEVMPEGQVEQAGGFGAQADGPANPFGIQQIKGEQPPAAAAMPPLPPTGEVLPEIIPKPQTNTPPSLPVATPSAPVNPPADNGEVLPFSDLMPEKPAGTPQVNPAPANTAPAALPTPVGLPPLPEVSAAPAPVTPVTKPELSSIPTSSPVTPVAAPSPTVTPEVNPLIGTADFDAKTPAGMQSPELKIEKIAPPEAEVGVSVIYAIIIRNVGGSEAKDVVVEDRIPRGAQLEGTIPQAYLNDGKLSWQLGTIEPGGERKIQLKVVPIEAGQIGSVATVSFASTVSASIKVNAPKLTIDMKGPTEVVFGEPLTYQFTLRNIGQGVAKSVFLRAVIPAGMKHPGGNDLEYECGTMLPGAEKIVDLVMQSERPGVYTVLAQVNNDGKTHADTRSDVAVINSRIELSRTGPENRFVGRPANCILKISNTSSDTLQGITIQEKLPAAVELAALPSGGSWDPRSRTLTWTMDKLKAGEAREISVLYVGKESGEHSGKLIAMDAAGNRATLDTVLNVKGFAELAPDYKADQRTVLLDERVTLQLSLKNAGTAAGRNVRTTFILPEGVEFISARGPVEYQLEGKQVQFSNVAEMPIGTEQVYHLAVLAKQIGTSKITLKLESDDYSEPVFQDQAIRVVPTGP